MRQKFDNGEDPLDPEQQQQGGHGNPFHGFNPFGGGGGQGFNFKFHFNWTATFICDIHVVSYLGSEWVERLEEKITLGQP